MIFAWMILLYIFAVLGLLVALSCLNNGQVGIGIVIILLILTVGLVSIVKSSEIIINDIQTSNCIYDQQGIKYCSDTPIKPVKKYYMKCTNENDCVRVDI